MLNKQSAATVLIAALTAAVISLLFTTGSNPTTVESAATTDTAFARIEQSNVVRCGYVNYPPFLRIDPNNGQISGIMYDITEQIGKITGWKIEWSYETSWPTSSQDLIAGKFDVMCAGSWPIVAAEKRQWGASPLFFAGVRAYVRGDDVRFNDTFDVRELNNPQYKISMIDGVAVDLVRALDFPKASVTSLPNLTSYSEMIEQVITKKADVVLVEQEVANDYLAANPGKLKALPGAPLRFYGLSYRFAYGEHKLRNVFDVAIQELLYAGAIDRILDAHEKIPGTFYRVALPYRTEPVKP